MWLNSIITLTQQLKTMQTSVGSFERVPSLVITDHAQGGWKSGADTFSAYMIVF